MTNSSQIDFYLLKSRQLDAQRLACRLALMAWERGHTITILTASDEQASHLNELMWESPAERFVPHEMRTEESTNHAPINIQPADALIKADVLINLCDSPVSDPNKCKRLLEIVPMSDAGLKASRSKYRHYRGLGITPETHEINR